MNINISNLVYTFEELYDIFNGLPCEQVSLDTHRLLESYLLNNFISGSNCRTCNIDST